MMSKPDIYHDPRPASEQTPVVRQRRTYIKSPPEGAQGGNTEHRH